MVMCGHAGYLVLKNPFVNQCCWVICMTDLQRNWFVWCL